MYCGGIVCVIFKKVILRQFCNDYCLYEDCIGYTFVAKRINLYFVFCSLTGDVFF